MSRSRFSAIEYCSACLIGVAYGLLFQAQYANGQDVERAFRETHEGLSTDELLIDDQLRDSFLRELSIDPQSAHDDDRQREALRQLLQLRKSGKLNVKTTRRRNDDTTRVWETAEVAIRTVTDRNRASIDDVLCDPKLRDELQAEAVKLLPSVSPRLIRKAVLRLRKTRRIQPELVLRVAEWEREILTMNVSKLDLNQVPQNPGVYLFRDRDGYLYIGEALRLADRLKQHFDGSHNEGLARLLKNHAKDDLTLELHIFGKNSPGSKLVMRRAYESELIRSRKPKFNVRP